MDVRKRRTFTHKTSFQPSYFRCLYSDNYFFFTSTNAVEYKLPMPIDYQAVFVPFLWVYSACIHVI